MYIKDLIQKLQELYASYDDEYKATAGEPEIMIDVFAKIEGTYHYQYLGFSGDIVIEKSPDFSYDVLNAFENKD